MKIEDAKDLIRRDGLTEQAIGEFRTALKQAPKANRCQHCYTLAMELPAQRRCDAMSLIRLGLKEYASGWTDFMFSHRHMARLREQGQDYSGAIDSWHQALEAIPADRRGLYPAEFATHMLRCELHRADFRPTEALETYYALSLEQDSFAASLLPKIFYRALAEMVLFRGTSKAEEAYAQALQLAKTGAEGPLTRLLQRHAFAEQLHGTPQALDFLKKWKNI